MLKKLLWSVVVVAMWSCSGSPPVGEDGGQGGGGGGTGGGGGMALDAGALAPAGDADQDGLSNGDETTGFDLQVDRTGLGTTTTEHVSSDPLVADTDGDGLTDLEEYQKTNPQRADTDGDQLTDAAEVKVYLSVPTSVDTDGDSLNAGRSSTQLWDGDEVNTWGTSPSLADTDGDQKSDYEEIIGLSRNPLVAQVPRVDLEIVGPLDVRLDVTYTNNSHASETFGSSYATETSSEASRTDGTSMTSSTETATSISVEVESGWPPSVTGSVSRTYTSGFSKESSTALTSTSAQSAQSEHNRSRELATDHTEATATGQLSVGFRVSNPSLVPYTLTNLTVTVYQFDEAMREFKTLATMQPQLSSFNVAAMSAQPLPNQVVATSVNADMVREFLRQPRRVFFGVSNFDISNAEGINYVFLDQTTSARTGRVVIDYGDGTVEDFRVATNVRRKPDGTPAGVTLGEVLGPKYLNIDHATTAWQVKVSDGGAFGAKDGKQVLTRVKTTETVMQGGPLGFWAIFSNLADITASHKNFDEAVLQRGETIYLVYVRDRDGDGVFDREEAFYGTSDMDTDTDGDGLSDFEEIRVGWTAGTGLLPTSTTYPKRVTSDPTTADADSDGLSDPLERMAGTDPFAADTDGDRLRDGVDGLPLDGTNQPPAITLTPTVTGAQLTLAGTVTDALDPITQLVIAWGDGSTTTQTPSMTSVTVNLTHSYLAAGMRTVTVTATDGRGATSTQTYAVTTTVPLDYAGYKFDANYLDLGPRMKNGQLVRAVNGQERFVTDRFGVANAAVQFQQDTGNNDYTYAEVSSFGAFGAGNFSVALWAKGGSGNYVLQSNVWAVGQHGGKVSLQLGTEPPLLSTTAIPTNGAWNHVAVVRSGNTITFYVNGAAAGTATSTYNATAACSSSWSKLFFSGAAQGTTCGQEVDPVGMSHEFTNAALDDVHLFDRALTASEIQAVYLERGFVP